MTLPCAWWLCSQINFSLQSIEIVIQPPVGDVNKALGRVVRSLLESCKAFVRWMDGTCIETPEQRGASEDDEPFVFTFYWDVSQNSQVSAHSSTPFPPLPSPLTPAGEHPT